MSFFGFKSSKEVEAEKKKALEAAAQANASSVSNLGRGSQVKVVVPYFDVFDPRLQDVGVPVSVHTTITYAIENMQLFNSLNKTEAFSDDAFQQKLKSTVAKYIKGVVANIPSEAQIPVVQLERKIMEISDYIQARVTPQVERTFGITVRALDVTNINIDIDSPGYRQVKTLTADLEKERVLSQHSMSMSNAQLQHEAEQSNFRLNTELNQSNLRLNNTLNQDQLRMKSQLNLDAMQRQQEMTLGGQEEMQRMQLEMQRLQNIEAQKIQLENQRETMRIQREEMQRASKLQTEQTFLGAHTTNLQAQTGTGAFGQVPSIPPMPGMKSTPIVPQVSYYVAVNGQQAGPFDWGQLQQMVQMGQLNRQSYVWTQGMANWEFAGNVQELSMLFMNQMPGMPPSMPGF